MKNKSPYKNDGMFNGASPLLFELAKDLRRNMTDAEMILWGYLKAGIKGYKFRRQHPIGIYIADFYCHKLKIVIEVDGEIHDQPHVIEYDKEREQCLKELGYDIIRFKNEEVFADVQSILDKINSIVDADIQKLI